MTTTTIVDLSKDHRKELYIQFSIELVSEDTTCAVLFIIASIQHRVLLVITLKYLCYIIFNIRIGRQLPLESNISMLWLCNIIINIRIVSSFLLFYNRLMLWLYNITINIRIGRQCLLRTKNDFLNIWTLLIIPSDFYIILCSCIILICEPFFSLFLFSWYLTTALCGKE